MLKHAMLAIAFVGSSLSSLTYTSAGEFGSADEAKAMLNRAIVEVKADKLAAIEKFNRNETPFRDRDLFVFCFNDGDGKFTAHEAMVSWKVLNLRDANGASFGTQMYDTAREAQIDEVVFISPMPGSTEFGVKSAFVSRIGDQVCGVSAFQIDGGNPPRIKMTGSVRW